MAKKRGRCRLCGQLTELSFEHIPPESAFNDQPLVLQTMQDRIHGRSHTKFRTALGNQSLCEPCNNLTGAWYGTAYAKWARQGLVWLDHVGEKSIIQIPFNIMPLNVLKQVVVMALAMTTEHSIPYHEELREFALIKERKYLPEKYNIYAYLTNTTKPRFESGMAVMNIETGTMDYIDAEIAFPPFGYCMTSTKNRTKESRAAQIGLYEIGWFSTFDYNLWTQVYLKMPKLSTNTPFPLDYRTLEEIQREHPNEKF